MSHWKARSLALLSGLGIVSALGMRRSQDVRRESGAIVVRTTVGKVLTLDLRDLASISPRDSLRAHFLTDANGLHIAGFRIRGTPQRPMVVRAVVQHVAAQSTKNDTLCIAVFAGGLREPRLPRALSPYPGGSESVPHRLLDIAMIDDEGEVRAARENRVTDAGARLGRVLFYDPRLSINDRVSCGSCHHQAFGFGDTARLSAGVNGHIARRHTMALTNVRFSSIGFSWDRHARTVEKQVLLAVQDSLEMGLSLSDMQVKLTATPFYRKLFNEAFGSDEVTSDRVARALAQFVRSMVSSSSRYDYATENGSPTTAARRMTPTEYNGMKLFSKSGCAQCHYSTSQIMLRVADNGIDTALAESARFHRAPSLRNVAVRGRYMHDGRFGSLDEVLDFYGKGFTIENFILGPEPRERRITLDSTEKAALRAFLETLTDTAFLNDSRYADPFASASSPRFSLTRMFGAAAGANIATGRGNPWTHSRKRNAPVRDSARLERGRLFVEPLGFSLAIPPLWLDSTRSDFRISSVCDPRSPLAQHVVTDRSALLMLTGTDAFFNDWQYAVFADSVFGRNDLVAHFGGGGWRECAGGRQERVRVYISASTPAQLLDRMAHIRLDSFPGFSQPHVTAVRDSGEWLLGRANWEFNCGDCISFESVEVMSRRVGNRTLSIVFMSGSPLDGSAARRGIMQSMTFADGAVASEAQPDSIVLVDALCWMDRCEKARASISRNGRARFIRRLPLLRKDSILVDSQFVAPALFDSLLHVFSARDMASIPARIDSVVGHACPGSPYNDVGPSLLVYGPTGLEKSISRVACTPTSASREASAVAATYQSRIDRLRSFDALFRAKFDGWLTQHR